MLNLEKLKFEGTSSKIGSFINNMINLKQLNLEWPDSRYYISRLDLSFLSNLKNLEVLKISSYSITNIEPIKELTKLKEFWVKNVDTINNDINIKPFPTFDDDDFDPEMLDDFLSSQSQIIFDISPISSCINLEKFQN